MFDRWFQGNAVGDLRVAKKCYQLSLDGLDKSHYYHKYKLKKELPDASAFF